MNKLPPQDRELIRKFMKQNLDKKENSLFQEKMQKEDFAQEVAEETVRWSARSKLQSDLKTIHKDHLNAQSRKRNTIAIAASFTIFLVSIASYFYITKPIPPSHSEIAFAKYFEPYPNVFGQRGTPSPRDQEFHEALVAYDRQDYAKANLLFATLLEKKTSASSYLPFYHAISFLAREQAEKAIPLLESILSDETAGLKPEAKWYLALAYLQVNQKDQARQILLDIQSKSTGSKKEEASLLLKEL